MTINIQKILEERKFIIDRIESAREIWDEEGNFVIPLYEFKQDKWKNPREMINVLRELDSLIKAILIKYIFLTDLSIYKGKLTEEQLATLRIGTTNCGKGPASFFYSPAYTFNDNDEIAFTKNDKEFLKVKQYLQKRAEWIFCGGLRLNIQSGEAIYGKVKTKFRLSSNQFKLLKALMEKPNQRLSYKEIKKIITPKKTSAYTPQNVSFIIRNIKRKLGILKARGRNKDIFRANLGYHVVCED